MSIKSIVFIFIFLFVVGAAAAGLLRGVENEPSTAEILSPDNDESQTNASSTGQSSGSESASTQSSQTRTDRQGAVIVEVTPLNLDSEDEMLRFQVAMNTHSVELGMDLTKLSTLTNSKGIEVNALSWDGASGGHHVTGTLSFPKSVNGISIVEEGVLLTLTIQNVDALSREFSWEP